MNSLYSQLIRTFFAIAREIDFPMPQYDSYLGSPQKNILCVFSNIESMSVRDGRINVRTLVGG
jgi:hypothetical protein